MFSRCLKYIFFFCKFEQCWTKALFKHLKKTSQRHFRRFPRQTAKATYEDVFKISKTHLFWKSNQFLSTPLFRQLMQTSANCLGRISKTNQYRIFLVKVPFNWPWDPDIRLAISLYLFFEFSKFDKSTALGLFTFRCKNLII